jgi:hypothetical protein
MLELACIYYEVHSRFYPSDVYYEAMDELGEMAVAMGYTLNDLAKICTWS